MFENSDREILINNGQYALSRICEEDRTEYVELQRQINGDGTFFLNPLSKDIMWDGTIADKGIHVILDHKMNFCGTVDLKDESSTPEIGISILEKYRNKGIARIAIELLLRLTFDPAIINYYIVRIEGTNEHSQHVFKKMGAIFMGEDTNALERFQEYLEKNNWDEKHKENLSHIFEKHEGDSEILKFKIDPISFLALQRSN